MEANSYRVEHSSCLICSSSINNQDNVDDDDQSVINFLLASLLEIPQNELVHLENKLVNWQANTTYCKSCKKLIISAKQIYTEILELTQKFRKVQKQIVSQISHSGSSHRGTKTSTSKHDNDEILNFCREFLNKSKDNFNDFGYPFVVNEIPAEDTPVHLVKEEPTSENEDDIDLNVNDYCQVGQEEDDSQDQDYQQAEDNDNLQNSSSSSANEDSQDKRDSDFEPSPSSKKAARKPPIKKPPTLPSSPQKKRNRKSPSSSSTLPNKKSKSVSPLVKPSKFDLLYPNYPKRLPDPISHKFHCPEPFCTKNYPRKTALETHIIVQHLQDNFYKCEEPSCTKSFAQQEHFKDHISWHAKIPRWKCEEKVTTPPGGEEGTSEALQCTEAFYSRKKLNRHIQQVHQLDKSFICEICGANYSCQDYLSTHKFTKHKDKHVKKVNVDSNVNEDNDESSNLICNYCGKIFNVNATLKVHINLVHEKTVGQFGCQFCECKFIAKNCLRKHLWGHHQFSLEGYQPSKGKNKVEEQPYRCEVRGCKVGFQKGESLRKHMEEKHGGGGGVEGGNVGEEGVSGFRFNCKYCGKGFHLKRALVNHESGVHENKDSKPFNCEICGKGFAIMRYVRMHMVNSHKIKGGAGAVGMKNV